MKRAFALFCPGLFNFTKLNGLISFGSAPVFFNESWNAPFAKPLTTIWSPRRSATFVKKRKEPVPVKLPLMVNSLKSMLPLWLFPISSWRWFNVIRLFESAKLPTLLLPVNVHWLSGFKVTWVCLSALMRPTKCAFPNWN